MIGSIGTASSAYSRDYGVRSICRAIDNSDDESSAEQLKTQNDSQDENPAAICHFSAEALAYKSKAEQD